MTSSPVSIVMSRLRARTGLPLDLNERDEVLVRGGRQDGEQVGLLWRGDVVTQVAGLSTVRALNNRADIAGNVFSADRSGSTAAVWREGSVRRLPSLPGQRYSTANDINDAGQVVGSSGTRAVVWTIRPRP